MTDGVNTMAHLIASDLDNTLLAPDKSLSARTVQALNRAREAGIRYLPVTARMPLGLTQVDPQAAPPDWALLGNGALGIHLGTSQVLFEATIDPEVQFSLVAGLLREIPGLCVASISDAGQEFRATQEYRAVARLADHGRQPEGMKMYLWQDVVSPASSKLVLRHPTLGVDHIMTMIRDLGLPGFEATMSGAPFVEIMAAGVTKATGLETMCRFLGIEQQHVIAFGDALNDVEMLRWAGTGVAVANASVEVLAAADRITAPNTEDGVARIIEELLISTGTPDDPKRRC